jgi:hypothetical protein
MHGRKNLQPKMFYQVNLDSLVKPDNFYRKLNEVLDLHFLYAQTAPYYGTEGQESIETRRPPRCVFQDIVSGLFE